MKIQKPEFFRKREDIPKGTVLIDIFTKALKELFFIENLELKDHPAKAKKTLNKFLRGAPEGVWIYYPWRNTAVHSLPENLYFKLRTARNRNLINETEQDNYRKMTAGIAGLSVGSSILNSLVISGGPKVLKIADPDIVDTSNLNRLKASLYDVGRKKVEVAARAVWDIDPFAEIDIWDIKLDDRNFRKFVTGPKKLEVFIEQTDNLFFKFFSRLVCREEKIPVVMATDYGDGVIVDIERFDQEPSRPIFDGRVKDIKNFRGLDKLKKLDSAKWLELANKVIGANAPARLKESLKEVGETLSAVPQLGTSASMAGSAISYVLRRIASKQKMPSGRHIISLEDLFL
ncbi:MAG: ThiF family adenylyltransferase [bacterium]|nr:ThiF family adenylyltransferase [bacterium]